MPAFTWPSTLYAVNCIAGFPIFHDIDPETWLMERPKSTETGCLLLVDVFGNQCETFDQFDFKRTIIDAAHGYGLPNLGRRGIAEVVSLSFSKVVTAMEGGMILTDDDKLAETARELRRLTARMTEISALIAQKSIVDLDSDVARKNILSYKKHITVSHKCQHVVSGTNNSVFCIVLEDSAIRDAIRIALGKAGVETKVYYDPLQDGHFYTDVLYSRILALPIHSGVTEHIEKIIQIINMAGRSARTPGKEFLTR
jgi:dTDP-4-amino-4,6-dideoxygalactose transaminase